MKIHPGLTVVLALAGAALTAPGSAFALPCYLVLDRSDNVIYRDTYPPIDLSDRGTAEREQMRRRGEQLIAMESERCPSLEFFIGNAGSPGLTVDQVVGGMPVHNSVGTAGGAPAARMAPPARRAAPAAPPRAPARGY